MTFIVPNQFTLSQVRSAALRIRGRCRHGWRTYSHTAAKLVVDERVEQIK
jgi:hypothetical protein